MKLASGRGRFVNRFQAGLLLFGLELVLATAGTLLLGAEGAFWLMGVAAVWVVLAPRGAVDAALNRYGAERLVAAKYPLLDILVDDLAQRAGLRSSPALYRIPCPTSNAFALGGGKSSAIVITEGMLGRLEPDELLAVMAHEISHIQHGDTRLMGLADVISRISGVLSGIGGVLLVANAVLWFNGVEPLSWFAVGSLLLSPLLLSVLQTMFSRRREYRADRGAVILTRDPGALASALQKLHTGDFSWLDYLLPASYSARSPSLLRRHPPHEKRVGYLLALMGKEVPPLHMRESHEGAGGL